MKTKVSSALVAIIVGVALVATSALAQSVNVQLTAIGTPAWQPVDIHTFSAPIGNFDDGFAEFFQTEQAILPPPNHLFDPAIGIVPGAPHAGPYDHELADGLAALNIATQTRFTTSAFSDPNAVWITWMTVPATNAPTGSSPDFTDGRIIPNSLFPITVAGVANHNGKVFDAFLASYSVPAVNALPTPFDVDGYSHFPNFVADSPLFGPADARLIGAYDYDITMTDATGNGWKLTARFRVVPDRVTTAR